MQSELEDMGFAPFCEALAPTRARCRIDHTIAERDEPFHIGLVYSDVTDTVYIYVDRFLEARTGGANTADLMRRLMELNWARLGAKFEWNPRTGEVRLSTLMHTDSNFDRRAFRSLVRTLTSEAAKQWPPLSRLVERDKP